jgi:hypothetical protein
MMVGEIKDRELIPLGSHGLPANAVSIEDVPLEGVKVA